MKNLFEQHPHWPVVDQLAKVLLQNGHRVVLAGGCVRDALLGRQAQDLDIATNATPEQVGSYFEKVLFIGKSFGVCRVVENGVSIEVATFREEGDYKDGRHPETVIYSTLEKDALRRDFTVNAMYYDLESFQLIDEVGGQGDLRAKKLVTVGDPERRFGEDLLRVLRAARFAAQLDFVIAPETKAAMAKFAGDLHKISRERVHDEFHKAFKSEKPRVFFEVMNETGVLKAVLPNMEWNKPVAFLGFSKTAGEVLKALLEGPVSVGVGWAAVLAVTHKWIADKKALEEWLKTFKLSHDIIGGATAILQAYKIFVSSEDPWGTYMKIAKDGPMDDIEWFWRRMVALFGAPETGLEKWLKFKSAYVKNGELPAPLINGDDLQAQGFAPKTIYKDLLDLGYRLQLEKGFSKSEILKALKN
jgi:tRNA nucleotidyltransferase/poly(A) polymerase